jgi:hypothetical protein
MPQLALNRFGDFLGMFLLNKLACLNGDDMLKIQP